jgi:hypothetical protein
MSTSVRTFTLVAALALAGCASFSGSSLVPGKSTAAEVEATMGAPAEKMPDGADSLWWYPRQPYGRASYAVRIGADNVVRSVEQRLTRQTIAQLRPGMSAKDVRMWVGPPGSVTRMPRMERDIWEYRWRDLEWMRLWVQFGYDGVVKEVLAMDDPERFPLELGGTSCGSACR